MKGEGEWGDAFSEPPPQVLRQGERGREHEGLQRHRAAPPPPPAFRPALLAPAVLAPAAAGVAV